MPINDSFVPDRRSRHRIVAEARHAASAGWLPSQDDAEHPYLQVIDHQWAAAALGAVKDHHASVVDCLTTMQVWLATAQVEPPDPGSHGPAARDQARLAADYQRLSYAAGSALATYEQARERLGAELARIDENRLTDRQSFLTVLRRHHPKPAEIAAITGPQPAVRLPPEHPDAEATRGALHRRRFHPGERLRA